MEWGQAEMRRLMAAAATTGLVMLMTAGCAVDHTPKGDKLYEAGAERYTQFATGVHDILMDIDESTWAVGQRDFGAAPIACAGSTGEHFFQSLRHATLTGVDADELERRALEAMTALDLEVTAQVFGSGQQREYSIQGSGSVFERVVVSIRPANGAVRVTAVSTCAPGAASELGDLVFAGSTARDQWRLLPATEGPASVPQFYFPPDGPVYYDDAGDPVNPQPIVTDPPVAPYGN